MTNNKTKPTTVPTPFFMGSNSLFCSYSSAPSSLPKWQRETRNGDCSQFVTLHLCCSFLLMLFPGSRATALPQEIVLCTLLQHGSLPQAAVLQSLFQYGPPMGSQVLSETCFPLGSPWGHSFLQAHQPLQTQVLHRPQVDLCSTMDLYEL